MVLDRSKKGRVTQLFGQKNYLETDPSVRPDKAQAEFFGQRPGLAALSTMYHDQPGRFLNIILQNITNHFMHHVHGECADTIVFIFFLDKIY